MSVLSQFKKPINYAEIGIDVGNAVLARGEVIAPGSTLHLFDITSKVKLVTDKITNKFNTKFSVIGYGVGDSTDKQAVDKNFQIGDGEIHPLQNYNWDLLKLVAQNTVKFDYCYLDGSHDLTIDGFAYFLLDKLLLPGGYIEFDDYNWTFGRSGSCSPYPPVNNKLFKERYTEEQINTSHVKLIVDFLVKSNNNYIEIEKNRIYKKIK